MPFVHEHRDSGLTVLHVDRPPANAVDLELADELLAAVDAADRADDPGAIVLVGQGAFFCAGIDLKAVPTYDAVRQVRMVEAIDRLVGRLYALDRPLVAAVNGHALGGGLIVALCCDWRVGTDDERARFGLPEVRVGVPYPAEPMRVVR